MTDIYNIIKNLNDQAYQYVYDIWTDADKLEGPLADERREDASITQCCYFRKLFDQLENDKKNLILKYAKTDKKISEDFNNWYEKSLILIPTLDDDILNALDLSIDTRKNKWFLIWLKDQDSLHSYLAKYQIHWIINEAEIYYKEMLELFKKNEIEKSDLDDVNENMILIKNFFNPLCK